MLQPRKTNRISDRCLKESYMLHLRITMPYSTYYKQNLALLTTLILTMAHIEACLAINQSYLLSPTPTFPAIAGDAQFRSGKNNSRYLLDFENKGLHGSMRDRILDENSILTNPLPWHQVR
ncbi:uncharacterized protein LOC108108683 isoform X5 [Drosophila eugracilis]|uniref:uncharacterized protein LOC108108683 isoform X5 n=1 Tax=Drosophila eugracilis TaxID=29029 RepID=UPI001BDAFB1A|nr:uncharacterized protein LOC108108683 isoform X5 [Drosophila eugracilis]